MNDELDEPIEKSTNLRFDFLDVPKPGPVCLPMLVISSGVSYTEQKPPHSLVNKILVCDANESRIELNKFSLFAE